MKRLPWILCVLSILLASPASTHSQQEAAATRKTDKYGDTLPRDAIARFSTLRLRHGGTLLGVAFSPDDKQLVTCGWDGIRIWEAKTGKPIRSLNTRPGRASFGAAFQSDGSRIATAHEGGMIRLWDRGAANELLAVKAHNSRVFGVAYAPQGDLFATAGNEGLIQVRRGASEEPVAEFRIPDRVRDTFGIAFSPDGTRLAAGSGKSLYLWNISTGDTELTIPDAHGRETTSLAFSRDGLSLFTGGLSNYRTRIVDGERYGTATSEVRQWDVRTGKRIRTFKEAEKNEGNCCITLSPDGQRLATVHREQIHVYETDGGTLLRTIAARGSWRSHGAAFAHDNRTLATITPEQNVRVYDTDTGQQRLRFDDASVSAVDCVAVSDDDRFVATGERDGRIFVRELDTGRVVHRWQFHDRACGVSSLAFSPDGKRVVAGGWAVPKKFSKIGGQISSWDIETGQELWTDQPEHRVLRVCYLSAAKVAAAGGLGESFMRPQRDPLIAVRDAQTGKVEHTLPVQQFQVITLHVSDQGRTLRAADRRGTYTWEIRGDAAAPKRTESVTLEGHQRPDLHAVAFSRDGKLVISSGQFDPSVMIRRASDGETRHQIDISDSFASELAVSPNGQLIATGSLLSKVDRRGGAEIRIRSIDGEPLKRFVPGHRRPTAMQFTNDGTRLISAHSDGTVLVWDVTGLTP